MNMRSNKKGYAATLLRTLLSAVVVLGALGGSQLASAAIKNTKHNLSNTGSGNTNHGGATATEICVFCHTPHGGKSNNVPLWNKNTPTIDSTYTLYNSSYSSTIDGSVNLSGGVSLACLSCHDGTQAMNNMINAPGSGQWDSSGASFAPYAVSGTNTASGKMGTGIITNLGKDLSNDHPIGIQYCGGGVTVSSPSAACTDPDFFSPKLIGTNVFWVPSSNNPSASTRTKNDIYLYVRDIGNGPEPLVECASCHDPHTEQTTFLRMSNDKSAVCLSCHNK